MKIHLDNFMGCCWTVCPILLIPFRVSGRHLLITHVISLNCWCFAVASNALQTRPAPPPPLPKGSFCSWNSAIIGTLPHDKTSISNVYSCSTEVAALFATVFPRLIMAATERLQGATLVGLDNREPPFETMVDEWHLLILCDCDY